VNEALHRRARAICSRCRIRAWEFRQLDHAKGAWFALRRLLAGSREAWSLSEDAAAALIAEGYAPDPAGRRFEPPRTLLVLPPMRLAAVADKRPLAVRLDAAFLSSPFVALVPFD
jgi:hypothetical protein